MAFGPARATSHRAASSKRRHDVYYTKKEVAANLIEDMLKYLTKVDYFIEPSAGNGVFVKALKRRLKNPKVIAFDIRPRSSFIKKMNFFDYKPTNKILGTQNLVVVFGNPPFGKNASTAVKFFEHASTFADVIAFILPRSFEKSSVIKRINREFHLVHSKVIKAYGGAFTFDDKNIDVPSVFQIWVHTDAIPRHPKWKFKKGSLRPKTKTLSTESKHVKFLKDYRGANLMIQRVGTNAGKVTTNKSRIKERKSSRNFYFVKLPFKPTSAQLKRLDNVLKDHPDKYKTAGMPSITKGLVVKTIHTILKL